MILGKSLDCKIMVGDSEIKTPRDSLSFTLWLDINKKIDSDLRQLMYRIISEPLEINVNEIR